MSSLGKQFRACLLLASVFAACSLAAPPAAWAIVSQSESKPVAQDAASSDDTATKESSAARDSAKSDDTDPKSEQAAKSDAESKAKADTDDQETSADKSGSEIKAPFDGSDGEVQPRAAAPTPQPAGGLHWALVGLIVVLVIVAPLWLGNYLAKQLRMPDHAWKIGLVLTTVCISSVVIALGWPPKLGPDLSGGINLIYEVDPAVEHFGRDDMDKLIAALGRRVNPGGLKEVTIRPYGERQVEIIIPKADDAEVELLKRIVGKQGLLEFRIVANPMVSEHRDAIELARKTPGKFVQIGDEVVARWIGIDMNQFHPARLQEFVTRVNRAGETQVLVMQDAYDVTGAYLSSATAGIDEVGRSSVNFSFKELGAKLFGDLTTRNAPNPGTGLERQLGIVLDETVLSAPNLREPITGGRGQISGNFSKEEVDFLVSILNAGSLPASLGKRPIMEMKTGATLGADTIRMSSMAMAVATLSVFIFVTIYYRFSGLVAIMALIINMLMLVAVMILLKAPFTLPGIAGLVLTVGMAVDANVLIFERIREELERGATMRMAIRNGFSRATGTIVDSNLTTLITAIVLFWIGTDQIRGFAVTLILGIIMSMYAGVFCSRVVFDVVEKQRWVTRINMMRILGNTNVDFLAKARGTIIASLIAIFIGFVAMVFRGKDLLDIDFTGGSSVTVAFVEPQDVNYIREAVEKVGDAPPTVVNLGEENTEFKIDTSIRDSAEVQRELEQIFGDKLRTIRMEYTPPVVTPATAVGALDNSNLLDEQDTQEVSFLQEETEEDSAPATAPTGPADEKAAQSADDKKSPSQEAEEEILSEVQSTTKLTLTEGVKHDSLEAMIRDAFSETGILEAAFTLENPEWLAGKPQAQKEWTLTISLPPDQTEKILRHVQNDLTGIAAFPSSSSIGGKVAGDTQAQAAFALFASLLGIVAYLWVRFQRVMYGLAAVIAVVHDVLIALAAVALSKYLFDFTEMAGLPNLLQLEPFKINLTMVAAFLTIIGYSLNDTIVIFDRIREIKGKSPELTEQMINLSVNQTLSRTILTSLTTLIVVVILYFAGGPGIHGFAFCLTVGIIAGTYSTVFIACPVLLWMSRANKEDIAKSKAVPATRAAIQR